MPAPLNDNRFQIEAEYLHLFVGRRVLVRLDRVDAMFTVETVRHEPEHGRVLIQVDAWTATDVPLEVEFVPGDVVEVEHAA